MDLGKSKKLVYFFSEKDGAEGMEGISDKKERKMILGGKGLSMHEMISLGIPVPPGFTIPTHVGMSYLKNKSYPAELEAEVNSSIHRLEEAMGKTFGGAENPLLVSVRSGGAVSMPGMMDTVLNLGLNDETVEGLATVTKNPRFAYDSYRRFIESYGAIVLGIKKSDFEEIFSEIKKKGEIQNDGSVPVDILKE
jgi:pyruvate,orthophosphate dikinase